MCGPQCTESVTASNGGSNIFMVLCVLHFVYRYFITFFFGVGVEKMRKKKYNRTKWKASDPHGNLLGYWIQYYFCVGSNNIYCQTSELNCRIKPRRIFSSEQSRKSAEKAITPIKAVLRTFKKHANQMNITGNDISHRREAPNDHTFSSSADIVNLQL